MRDTTRGSVVGLPGSTASGGCCPTGLAAQLAAERMTDTGAGRWVRPAAQDAVALDLMVPAIRCAACMSAIETGLSNLPGVASARVNLSLRRVRVLFDPARSSAEDVVGRLSALGYEARPFDAKAMADIDRDAVGRDLLARLGVAGFAMMNVMLLSVAVWSGADAATRDLMHWISGLIALPAIAFSGVPFFRSAIAALRAGRVNMDVPISLAVVLAVGVSLYETAHSGEHAYFDAGISLVFFLLIGRYLDHRTRAVARSAAAELTALSARAATVIAADGSRTTVAAEDLAAGMLAEVLPGERIPADGRVEWGQSDLDRSMVTGETMPEAVGPGAAVHAGMLNVSGPLRVRVGATGEATLLAEIARMIEAAERGRTRYDRWADKASRQYVWGVHVMSCVAFGGWMWATGGDVYRSVMIAAAVLIITCPCALGLAVPAVHAVAGGRLFRRGIFLKDGAILERLAEIDTVVFDKTGTLTEGRPVLVSSPECDRAWQFAASLAVASRHPLAQALAESARGRGIEPVALDGVTEVPGAGVEGWLGGKRLRLGRADWVGAAPDDRTAVWLAEGDAAPQAFAFEDRLRADAPETVAWLRAQGLRVALFSGDSEGPVARAAEAAGIGDARARMTPAAKLAALEALARGGARVLMVGDGINDAPSLAAAHASMSPVAASDVSRAATGLVFTGQHLAPVRFAIETARAARARALENFAFSALYNVVAVPVALFGFVTPLIAALSMSGSSIVVTLNALRIRRGRP
ncbi:cadmium-translocating P-type ATPase [Limibaculum sp. FT325]|uniref:heavy metal translocating P-type ATPase n=1 Tax=Thermohalobaculum sediminis TaxID=2939436 RepID=UPI00203748F5|nr:heavy metal translocating P-type ATPase [Limibaculum sediminis]MCL5776391.1 cadmium-translocating P-type ATPase [Limibaculum sediminis]